MRPTVDKHSIMHSLLTLAVEVVAPKFGKPHLVREKLIFPRLSGHECIMSERGQVGMT